jgi:F-type H+-transporting ATPase subunit a
MVRSLLILGLVVAGVVFAYLFTPHGAGDNPFIALFGHLVPHALQADGRYLLAFEAPWFPAALDGAPAIPGTQIVLTNLQVFQLLALAIVVIAFSGVPAYLRSGRGDRVSRLFAGFALWVRDEMVYPVMGREVGARFLPFLLTLFFFVLFMNLLGLVPGGSTATASIFVTGGLALITLCVMFFGGMVAQGPVAYWKNLVPHVPLAIWPIMFVVEFVGIFVKPFALMIRLFANMTGGHMVVLSFMGLLFVAAQMAGDMAAWAASPLVLAFAVFIMIIESFVALLQAYVFTMLSILFIQASIHPEH